MRIRYARAGLLPVALAACGETVGPPPTPDRAPGATDQAPAPLFAVGEAGPGLGRYIVVFKASVGDPEGFTDELIRTHGGQAHFRYQSALKGFAATLPAQALDGIRRNPNVELVEADGVAYTSSTATSSPSWGLDRLDARDLPLDGLYAYQNDGTGVRVYVIDTGVLLTHVEYAGRVASGWDFVDNDGDASDCHGHGTHVAGTVAGTTVGVAKGASIVSVRVLNCMGNGWWSQVIAGIDWVTANHIKPAVANMSLSGGFSASVNTAVNNAVAAGVTFAVAAGNENQDACVRSPASAASALTVGATTNIDARASFSNYGTCLDLFAPGASIYSSVKNGGYESWSGTSMAAPHVAGVAALYLASHPTAIPSTVSGAIIGDATLDHVTGAGIGSPNRLLYSLIAGPGTLPPLPPPPPPPPAVEVHVGDLDGTPSAGKGNWSASVSILVLDVNGAPMPNTAVSGSWSDGATGSGTCTTGSNGRCSVGKSGIKKNVASTRFTVGNVSAAGTTYSSSQNTDPDGDSDGTTITVRRPYK